jgi:hypothetical protein
MSRWALWALLTSAAPAASSGDTEPAYLQAQAEADVETVVTDSSKAYLHARGRLEAHPKVAALALRARLDAVPAPGPSEQRRLLGVLAQLRQPEDGARFAAALRRAVVNADPGADLLDVAHPWRTLLVEQGPVATPHLQTLIGDTALSEEVRSQLLGDWVRLLPADRAGEMVVLIGRGQPALERELRRTLAERAKRDRAARTAVVAATDAALDAALGDPPNPKEAERLPTLLRFRARIGGDDTAMAKRLVALATDDDARFGARVASIRDLGALPPEHTAEPLRTLADKALRSALEGSQRGEVLGWLALQSLPEADAAPLAEQHDLRSSDAPRLAALGFSLAPPSAAATWLPLALGNPWPQVRQAAFERVEGPCAADTVDALSTRGSSTDEGGDTDRATARAAVAALGRCEADKPLRDILVNARGDVELRAEAARQLARLGKPEPVVRLLRSRPEPAFARRLAAALRHAPDASEDIDATLCAYVEQGGPIARAAADTLRAHHPDVANPCRDD